MKKIIIALGFITTSFWGISQTSNSLVPKINIPTSPEAALIKRFGDVPVGHYTGTANVSIPLFTIKEGPIEIPIQLSYHNSGIKVADQATWVGLGWNLSPEGTIIQEVRGKQDHFDNKLNYALNPTAYNTFINRIEAGGSVGSNRSIQQIGHALYDPCMSLECDNSIVGNESGDDDVEIVSGLLNNNGQPDIYHFNFLGHSGKFYINPLTSKVVQLDKKEELRFTVDGSASITITTLDGISYLFDEVEVAYELGLYPHSDRAGRTYKLSTITTPQGHVVTFSYTDAHIVDYNYSETSVINDLIGSNMPSMNLNTRQSDVKILTRITTSDAIVEFSLENREDVIDNLGLYENAKRLGAITLISASDNAAVKKFVFSYSYFPYNFIGVPSSGGTFPSVVTSYEGALGKRLKLESIREFGYNDEGDAVSNTNPYQFEYDLTNTMPLKISFAKDFWGYYNGRPNQTLLPELGYFDYPEIYKANTNNIPFSYNYIGANRYTDNSKAGAYLLKKITYPTGGHTVIEVEPNTFSNQFIPDNGDAVFKSIDVQDHSLGGTTYYQFRLSKETLLHFENSINNGEGNYNNVTPLTYAQMEDCYIRLRKMKILPGLSPQFSTLKQWDLTTVLNADFTANGGKHWSEDFRVSFDDEGDVSYFIEVYFPDNLNNYLFASIAGVTSHLTYFDDTDVDVSSSNQCGFRVKSIKSYSAEAELVLSKKFSYEGGKLLTHFNPFLLEQGLWNFECVNVNPGSCPQFMSSGPYNRLIISSESLTGDWGNPIGYDLVREQYENENGSISNGEIEFQFFNFENSADPGFLILTDSRNGLIKVERSWDKDEQLRTETNFSYQNLVADPEIFYNLTIRTHFVSGDPRERASLGGRHKFSYNASPLISIGYKVQSKESIEYRSGQSFGVVESYTYNSEGSFSSIVSVDSKGDELITKYFYPIDNMIDPLIDDYMISQGVTGVPVITEQYKGATLLNRKKTVYGAFSGLSTYMPKQIYSKSLGNAEELRVSINAYDSRGNITEYREVNNVPVSIVWNANKTLPLARIENASYAILLGLPDGLASDFRTELPEALVTTYTHKPLIGLISMTGPDGRTVNYEYDILGRLKLVRDNELNIIKRICYNYAGVASDCDCDGTSPNWQNTVSSLRCKLDENENFTGEREREQRDINPCSPTYNQTRWMVTVGSESNCPINSGGVCTTCSGNNYRCISNVCTPGIKIHTSSQYNPATGLWDCTYHYEWSGGTIWSPNYVEHVSSPCIQ